MRLRKISVIPRGTKPVNNPGYIGGLELTTDYRAVKSILEAAFSDESKPGRGRRPLRPGPSRSISPER